MVNNKILVIVPKYNNSNEPDYAYMFPLGLAYVVAALRAQNLAIEVLNLNYLKGSSTDLVAEALDKEKYPLVCTGGNNLIYRELKNIVTTVKKHPSAPLTVLGGHVVTTEPEVTFNDIRPDYGVIGEAEDIIGNLAEALLAGRKPEDIPGTIFEKNGKVMQVPSAGLANIDAIPFPAMDMMGYKEWQDNMPSNIALSAMGQNPPRVYPIVGSRNCPFKCTFCYHFGKYQERSLDNIFAELNEAIKKYQINYICFYDDCFSLKPERVKEFCNRIKELRSNLSYDLQWAVQITVKKVDEEMFKLLKESGCNAMAYGFESFNQKVLDSMHKPITPEEIDYAFKLTLKYNFLLYALFIFGDTAETVETYKETLDYWKKNAQGQIRLDMIRIFPGSEIYKKSVQKGLIKDKISFFENDMPSEEPVNFTDAMSDFEYQVMRLDVTDAKRRFIKHVVPKLLETSGPYFDLELKCPFCGKKSKYKNVALQSRLRFCEPLFCRHCLKRCTAMSRISWLWMHFNSLRYFIIKLVGVKRLWRFKFLFKRLFIGG